MVLIELTQHSKHGGRTSRISKSTGSTCLLNPSTIEMIEPINYNEITVITTMSGEKLTVTETVDDICMMLQRTASIHPDTFVVIKRMSREDEPTQESQEIK